VEALDQLGHGHVLDRAVHQRFFRHLAASGQVAKCEVPSGSSGIHLPDSVLTQVIGAPHERQVSSLTTIGSPLR